MPCEYVQSKNRANLCALWPARNRPGRKSLSKEKKKSGTRDNNLSRSSSARCLPTSAWREL